MNRKECLDFLGLKEDATDEEIKLAFRKLAKVRHPDIDKENVNACKDFIKLKDVYVTLIRMSSKRRTWIQIREAQTS